MRYSAKKKQDISVSPAPIETIIPLLEPVKTYTAKELAAMPLSKMNEAIEAQERFFILEHTTRMGGGCKSSQKFITGWRLSCSGQREVKNTIQAKQRVYRTSHCPPVGNAWSGQVGRG